MWGECKYDILAIFQKENELKLEKLREIAVSLDFQISNFTDSFSAGTHDPSHGIPRSRWEK